MRLNDLDLNKLATFLAVAQAGGVSKAARQLGRTASAVSQSVSSLEASLGVLLFDRVRKELVLTRGGQRLRERLVGYHALLEEAVAELSSDGAAVTGSVRLGLFLGFPRVRSRELLVAFGERHPRASVRVVHAPQQDLEARLRKNALDFVLSFAPQFSPDLVSTRLFAQELVLASSPSHFRGGFSLRELATTPVVDYYQSDPVIQRWLAHHFPGHAAEPHVRFWAATTDLVLELVQSGAGVGILPGGMLPLVAGKSARGAAAVRAVGPARPLIDHVWLNEPRRAYRDRTQLAFREVLLEVLASDGTPREAARARRAPR